MTVEKERLLLKIAALRLALGNIEVQLHNQHTFVSDDEQNALASAMSIVVGVQSKIIKSVRN